MSESVYSFRDWGPVVLERGRENQCVLEVHREGSLVVPDAAPTFLLYDQDGTTVLHTVTSTLVGGKATATVPASVLHSNRTFGESYRIDWTNLQLNGEPGRAYTQIAVVARQALNPVVTDADLYEEYPDLGRELGTTITSWQTFIDGAWKTILNRLRQQGAVPHLIVSDYDLREAHRHLALYRIFKWFHRSNGVSSSWLDLMNEHKGAYEAAFGSMTVRVDADEDGVVDGESRAGTYARVGVNPAPTRTRSSSRWW